MPFCRAKVQTLKNENEFDLKLIQLIVFQKIKSQRNKSYTGKVEHFKDFVSTRGASRCLIHHSLPGKRFFSDFLLLNLVEANAIGNPIPRLILSMLWVMWLVFID